MIASAKGRDTSGLRREPRDGDVALCPVCGDKYTLHVREYQDNRGGCSTDCRDTYHWLRALGKEWDALTILGHDE